MYKLVIKDIPVAKKRPRFCKNGHVYDSQKDETLKIKIILMQQMAQERILKPIDGTLRVGMAFHVPVPLSWSQKRLKSVLGKPCDKKPDVDNYAKLYLDCMNGLVYHDDNQVSQLWCEKIYSDTPRTEIYISKTEEKNLHEFLIKGNNHD